MFSYALFIALIIRCGLDIFLPGEKGTGPVALYVVITFGLMFVRIVLSGLAIDDAFICIGCAFLLTVNLMWIPAEVAPQLYFSSTILVPIVFLLVLSRSEASVFTRLRRTFAKFGIPLVGGFILMFLLEPKNIDLLTYLNTNPMHVVAQTVAKVSILTINEWIGFPIFALIVLGLFNVRSAMMAFLFALLSEKYKSLLTLNGFLILFIVCVASITFLLSNPELSDAFIQRLLFRNRDFLGESITNLSSGRDEIWSYYIQVLENSSLLEILFGRGALWLYGSFNLPAHNDFLNLMVCYGIAGTIAVTYAWYRILWRLAPEFKKTCIITFLVLFVTNGVAFHQSNVLFLLFMTGQVPPMVSRREQTKLGSSAYRNSNPRID